MPPFPDFTKIELDLKARQRSRSQWERDFAMETGTPPDAQHWMTHEKIPVKPLYTATDKKAVRHLG